MKNFKAVERFCCSQYCGISCRLNLQYCGSDFIGQGVGYLGNAATNVAYPFSTICLAIALLVGIGSASHVSLCLGRKEPKAAAKAAGNGIVLMEIFGIIYLLVGETFLSLLLKAFGATTDVFHMQSGMPA